MLSLECYEKKLDLAKQTGDKEGEGNAYDGLGNYYYSFGQYDKAVQYYELWLNIAKQIVDGKAGDGRTYGMLGNCHYSLGQYDKALQYYKLWLNIAKKIGDKADEKGAYGGLGKCHYSLGQYSKAVQYYELGLSIAKRIGDEAGEGRTYGGLGNCHHSLGQYGKAVQYYLLWLNITKQIEDKGGEGGAYGGLGNCHYSLVQYDKAKEYYELWLIIAKQIGDKAGERGAYGGLGNCHYSLGQYDKAVQYYKLWLYIAEQIGDMEGKRRAYGGLENCYSSLGEHDKASDYRRMYTNSLNQVGNSEGPSVQKTTIQEPEKHDKEDRKPVHTDKLSPGTVSLAESGDKIQQLSKVKYSNPTSYTGKTFLDPICPDEAKQDEFKAAKCESKAAGESSKSPCKEVEEMSSVPAEILARGPKAVEAFHKALREGKTRVRRVPIMIIGQERAGKTSLLKSLKGEKFDPQEESTRGIAIDPCHCKVTQEVWKAGKSDDQDVTAAVSFEHHAAVLTCKYLVGSQESRSTDTLDREEKHVAELESDFVLKHDSQDDSNTRQGSRPASPDRGSSPFESGLKDVKEETQVYPEQPDLLVDTRDNPEVLEATGTMATNNDTSTNHKSDVPEEIIALIEKLMQKKELEDDSDIYCTLWDFAGQSVFYTTHSLFLTHGAIYLLVNDLSKSPDQEADPLRKQGLFRKPYDDFNFAKTNLDFLHYWMTSIASFGSNENTANKESSVSLPPVIFVSTHADTSFGDASPRDLARDVFGSLQKKPYKSHLVEDFFVVDNTRSGSGEEDKEVPRLREKILELCRELQKLQKDIPLKWLKFEKTLKATVHEGFHSLKFSEAEKVAFDVCGITDENEFRAVLDFLHDHRILVHFDDSAELDDLVVLDPQWLIDILKEVITVKPFESEQGDFVEHWKELEDSGILKKDLLEHVWRDLLNRRNTIEALVSIMEKFNLICRWSSSTSTEEYLVPHMLKSQPVSKELTELLSSAVVPSLFIKFPCVEYPQVCFSYLMVCLINEWKKEQPCFQRPKLFRNFVRLFLNPLDSSSIVLFCHSSVIEIALCAPTTPSAYFVETTCGRVVGVLRRVLNHMRRECRWLKSMSYELCFRCPVCCEGALQLSNCGTHHVMDCIKEDCAHFYSEKELQNAQESIRCEKSEVAVNTKVPLEKFSPWLEGNSEHKKNRTQAGEMAVCLPDDIMSVMQSADKVTVVQRATEHLQLDEAALIEPTADTRQKVRGLANLMKMSNRADAVRHLRTLVPSGTTGPLLDERLSVCMMPHEERRELTVFLSAGEEWKDVASKLGLSNVKIRFLDRRTRNPADAMMDELEERNPNCTVGHLYDVLVENDMAVAADIM